MLTVYPFGNSSLVTSSHAVTSSYADFTKYVDYVYTSSTAGTILNIRNGPPAAVNICTITYAQYLELRNDPTKVEDCNFN